MSDKNPCEGCKWEESRRRDDLVPHSCQFCVRVASDGYEPSPLKKKLYWLWLMKYEYGLGINRMFLDTSGYQSDGQTFVSDFVNHDVRKIEIPGVSPIDSDGNYVPMEAR